MVYYSIVFTLFLHFIFVLYGSDAKNVSIAQEPDISSDDTIAQKSELFLREKNERPKNESKVNNLTSFDNIGGSKYNNTNDAASDLEFIFKNSEKILQFMKEEENKHKLDSLLNPEFQEMEDFLYETIEEKLKRYRRHYSKDHLAYKFSYEVEDDYEGVFFGHSEHRIGKTTQGQYKVKLPDDRLQIVTYIADDHGYRSNIEYKSFKNGKKPESSYEKPTKNYTKFQNNNIVEEQLDKNYGTDNSEKHQRAITEINDLHKHEYIIEETNHRNEGSEGKGIGTENNNKYNVKEIHEEVNDYSKEREILNTVSSGSYHEGEKGKNEKSHDQRGSKHVQEEQVTPEAIIEVCQALVNVCPSFKTIEMDKENHNHFSSPYDTELGQIKATEPHKKADLSPISQKEWELNERKQLEMSLEDIKLIETKLNKYKTKNSETNNNSFEPANTSNKNPYFIPLVHAANEEHSAHRVHHQEVVNQEIVSTGSTNLESNNDVSADSSISNNNLSTYTSYDIRSHIMNLPIQSGMMHQSNHHLQILNPNTNVKISTNHNEPTHSSNHHQRKENIFTNVERPWSKNDHRNKPRISAELTNKPKRLFRRVYVPYPYGVMAPSFMPVVRMPLYSLYNQ